MYDRSTIRPYKVLLLTCVVNCTAGTPTPQLCPVVHWSVHWALSRTTRVLVLARARRCALETCGEKKCELRFQAWLNLYIKHFASLHITPTVSHFMMWTSSVFYKVFSIHCSATEGGPSHYDKLPCSIAISPVYVQTDWQTDRPTDWKTNGADCRNDKQPDRQRGRRSEQAYQLT